MPPRRRRRRGLRGGYYRTQYLQPQVYIIPQEAGLEIESALLVFAAVALAFLVFRK